MTRVNVVPPSELCRQHLIAEIREIPRVCTLARKNTEIYLNASYWRIAKRPPSRYTLGTGHVNFFVDRCFYIAQRYVALCEEWLARGYQVNMIPGKELLAGIHCSFLGDYKPTEEAIALNRARIAERLLGMSAKPKAEITLKQSDISLADIKAEAAFKEYLQDIAQRTQK